jgi:hypothetical protein
MSFSDSGSDEVYREMLYPIPSLLNCMDATLANSIENIYRGVVAPQGEILSIRIHDGASHGTGCSPSAVVELYRHKGMWYMNDRLLSLYADDQLSLTKFIKCLQGGGDDTGFFELVRYVLPLSDQRLYGMIDIYMVHNEVVSVSHGPTHD